MTTSVAPGFRLSNPCHDNRERSVRDVHASLLERASVQRCLAVRPERRVSFDFRKRPILRCGGAVPAAIILK